MIDKEKRLIRILMSPVTEWLTKLISSIHNNKTWIEHVWELLFDWIWKALYLPIRVVPPPLGCNVVLQQSFASSPLLMFFIQIIIALTRKESSRVNNFNSKCLFLSCTNCEVIFIEWIKIVTNFWKIRY